MLKTVGVMSNDLRLCSKFTLLGAFLAGSIFVSNAPALEPQQGNVEALQTPAAPSTVPGTAPVASSVHPHRQRKLASPYRSKGTSIHEQQFYQINWGVDSFAARGLRRTFRDDFGADRGTTAQHP